MEDNNFQMVLVEQEQLTSGGLISDEQFCKAWNFGTNSLKKCIKITFCGEKYLSANFSTLDRQLSVVKNNFFFA